MKQVSPLPQPLLRLCFKRPISDFFRLYGAVGTWANNPKRPSPTPTPTAIHVPALPPTPSLLNLRPTYSTSYNFLWHAAVGKWARNPKPLPTAMYVLVDIAIFMSITYIQCRGQHIKHRLYGTFDLNESRQLVWCCMLQGCFSICGEYELIEKSSNVGKKIRPMSQRAPVSSVLSSL
jgi:hypothetical protein